MRSNLTFMLNRVTCLVKKIAQGADRMVQRVISDQDVNTIAVIGAGQMGRGIAQVAAQCGYQLYWLDTSPQALKEGYQFISKQLDLGVQKGKWSQEHCLEALNRIIQIKNISDLDKCDLCIEAVSENKTIKFDLFKKLDEKMPPQTLLCSNTSSISITEIGAITKRPEQVVGMHFMNPVPLMKLVEGIRGLKTSDTTFNIMKQVAEKMGKTVIAAKDVPGFVVNRILMPMINEACYALQQGIASASDIDQSMKLGCHQPMGPLELADFIGLDTCLAIMNVLFEGLGETKYHPCPLLKQYVAAGCLGRKTGRGFYQYNEGD